jgi:hypothetical protein
MEQLSSSERMSLHLSEIGRLQNNAGSTLQFMALIFVICVYYFNALIYPSTPYRAIFALALIVTASLVTYSCIQFVRVLMAATLKNTQGGVLVYSKASEAEIEITLDRMAHRFRGAAYVFLIGLFCTFLLLCLLALANSGQLGMPQPK